MIGPDRRIRRNERVVYRELKDGEGGLLLHLDSGAYHGINAVGALTWSLIDGERTVAAIVSEVRARVNEPPSSLAMDLSAFLTSLRERELIWRDGPA